jgi:hypothetical protein
MDHRDNRRHTRLPFTGAFKAQFNNDSKLWQIATYPDEAATHKEQLPRANNRRPESHEQSTSQTSSVQILKGHLRQLYIERFKQSLGEDVIVSQLKPMRRDHQGDEIDNDHQTQLYAIRRIEIPTVDEVVKVLPRIHHENFVIIYQLFRDDSICYTVTDLDEISLYDFCKPKFEVTEVQMAAILSQVSRHTSPCTWI